MKKKLELSIELLLLLSIVVGCSSIKENNNKVKTNSETNINTSATKDQQLDVFTFKKTSLVYENNTSILTTTVTNNSNKTEYLQEFKIHIKDELGNDIVVLPGYVGSSIEANSSVTITSSYSENLTYAKSIEYEIVR